MKLSDVIAVLHDLAPLRLAESWDNVGLLVGDPSQTVKKCLLAIDYTTEVAEEARAIGCEMVVSYHPPIFSGLKNITAPSLIFEAIRSGVAIYSPHTALDVVPGGTNDLLAEILGLSDIQPLRPIETKSIQYKLVTFVPPGEIEKVAQALFDAGAGRIGNYSNCSFRSPGEGTFLGDQSTRPAVGEKGKFQKTPEIRLETILPVQQLAAALAALYRTHPYEEPAFDLVQLATPPERSGQGRIGSLPDVDRAELFTRIKKGLSLSELLIAGPVDGRVKTAACLAGAGRQHLDDAIAQGAQLYLTGELPHHDALKAARVGVTVVATLHSNSERASLPRLARRMGERLRELEVYVSKSDRDPFIFV